MAKTARARSYLSVDDATITFDAQGGTFKDDSLKTMTAPILSEVDSSKVPSVAKSGQCLRRLVL